MATLKRTLQKQRGDRWCELEVRIEDGRLSVTGSEGRIVSARTAKREAREYWESFLEDSPEEMVRMARKYRRYTPRSAARFILQTDGEFHGLDVDREVDGRIYLTESCGQIRGALAEWFPEVYPQLAPWHLNDMHAECPHQEARGETYATHPGAECPDCGYKLGSAWTTRALPVAVIAVVEGIGGPA